MKSSQMDTSGADVTVVVATYNGERFVEEQVRSIFTQTVPPRNIILSDDGSTDRTLTVLQSLADQSPCAFEIIETGGRQDIRKNFLEASLRATTEFIAFCDQDDVWHPTKLEICLKHFDREQVQLVAHSARVVDEQLRPTRRREPAHIITRSIGPGRTDPWRPGLNGFALVFRRSVLRFLDTDAPLQHAFPKMPMLHDNLVALAAGALGRTVYLRDTLALYRQHSDNVVSENMEVLGEGNLSSAELQRYLKNTVLGWRDWMLDAAREASAADDLERAHAFRSEARRFALLAQAHDERAVLREMTQLREQASQLRRMITKGTYAPRWRGGLGPRSLVRDLLKLIR